jgi:hypothetical protein
VIDGVVVHQRREVNELDDRRGGDRPLARLAADGAREQDERGAERRA